MQIDQLVALWVFICYLEMGHETRLIYDSHSIPEVDTSEFQTMT